MVETDIMETLAVAELAEGVAQGDTQELTEAPAPPENFLEKPLSDYSTTEGLLLLILLFLFAQFIVRLVKEGFHWL